MKDTLWGLLISAAILVCVAPAAAQQAEPFRYKLEAAAPVTATFSYRGREPAGPPPPDDFFDQLGFPSATNSEGECQGGGLSGAINCEVTEELKKARQAAPGSDGTTNSSSSSDEGKNSGPTLSKATLTLTPELKRNQDGTYTVNFSVAKSATFSGEAPNAELKTQLESEALQGLPADMERWSTTFTQEDLANFDNDRSDIIYNLSDQFRSRSLYNADGEVIFRLNYKKVFDPQIMATVLIDDQYGQRLEEGETQQRNYVYPYKPNGQPTDGEKDRYLLVLGKHLPGLADTNIVSGDPTLTYVRLPLPHENFHTLAHGLSGVPHVDGDEALYLKANLAPGVSPGETGFKLNGQQGRWGLGFLDSTGTLAFLRPDRGPGDVPERIFYFNEEIQVGVRTDNVAMPSEGVEVMLEGISVDRSTTPPAVGRRQIGAISLSSPDDNEIAKSAPFLLVKAEADASGPPTAAQAATVKVALAEGEQIAASIVDPYEFQARPRLALATIKDGPPTSSLWQTALDKVGRCPTVRGDSKSDGFARETSTVIEDWIFMGNETRHIEIKKGDQAALALIRDELLPLVEQANERLLPFIGDGRPGERKAQRYWSDAKNMPGSSDNPFWKLRKATFGVQDFEGKWHHLTVPLHETFRLNALNRRLNSHANRDKAPRERKRVINIVSLRDLVNREVRRNLKEQHDQTAQAIGRAIDAGYCNVKELLVIAGQRADAAIANLLPKLIKKEGDRWVPDRDARRYVNTVFITGNAVKAQKELDAIDTTYASLALAAGAAIITFGGSAIAATTTVGQAAIGATYISMAADLADIGYFGRKGVINYLEGERNYGTAMGLAPVLGSDSVSDAASGRQSAVMTAVGLLMPGVSLGSSISSLRSIKNIEAGRSLLRTKNFNSIDELTDPERIQLAAYYKNLQDQDASKFKGLFSGEKKDLDLMDRLLDDASRARSQAEAREIMNTRFGLPKENVQGTMPRGKVGGLAQLDKDIPRGMPAGSDRGLLDKTILQGEAGKVVQDTRPFGMLPTARRGFQKAVDEAGLAVRVRAANDTSLAQMRSGHPPKHVKLKSKTINDLDVELGAKPGTQGMVGYFKPKKPGDLVLPAKPENTALLPKWEEDVAKAQSRHAALEKRYAQRLKEHADNATDINKLKKQGLISVDDGVVVDRGLSNTRLNEKGDLVYNRAGAEGGTAKGFTGDHDMWDIRHPDGRPISIDPKSPDFDEASYIRKVRLQQVLDEGLAKTQHGPHKDWTPVSQRDIGIDAAIRKSHNPGGETLLEFQPGEKLPRTSYEINDEGKLIPPKSDSPDFDPDKTIAVKPGDIDPNETVAVPRRHAAYDPELERTVAVNPNSVDPSEGGTMVLPGARGSSSNPATPGTPASSSELPDGQVDVFQNPAGQRLLERGILLEDIDDLIARSRRGEALTTEEMQTKIDYLRVLAQFDRQRRAATAATAQ